MKRISVRRLPCPPRRFAVPLAKLFFLFAPAWSLVWPQATFQTPQEVYEGQMVSAIDLIANPHRDVEPLRPLVVQKTGQPFSGASVQTSIAALRERGGFPKVELNVVPDPAGLRLDFVLEPSYYVGAIDFSGASKYFSYTRLLQVADLSEADPYDKARVPVAQTALLRFLQKNGYFQAAVSTRIQIDDAHELVNVTFLVEMGKQARIGQIEFTGPDSPQDARLEHAVRSFRARFTGGLLKPGKSYTPERIKAATTLIKNALARQHRLASVVREDRPVYDAATNRVNVFFKIDIGPVVTVQMSGARLHIIPFLSSREMKKLIPIYSERSVDRDLVDEGQQNLLDYFQKKGYFDAKVATTFERQPNQILVAYQIDRGKKHRVDSITFHGNHQISQSDLSAQVTVKKSHLWTHGSVSQKIVKQSVDNLLALYRDKGYEEAKVTSQITDHEPKIDVAFDIEEGPQTLIAKVQVAGNSSVPLNQLTAPRSFEARSGGSYSARRLAQDRNRIAATYLNRGYLTPK